MHTTFVFMPQGTCMESSGWMLKPNRPTVFHETEAVPHPLDGTDYAPYVHEPGLMVLGP